MIIKMYCMYSINISIYLNRCTTEFITTIKVNHYKCNNEDI